MRLYFYLGMNIPAKDYKSITFAMRVMVTGHGYDKEKFKAIEYSIKKRRGYYNERKSCLMVFDCRNSRYKVVNNPEYEQKLLGHRGAFMLISGDNREWQSISPEDRGRLFVVGQRTYVDF